jgi:hypothetical protein
LVNLKTLAHFSRLLPLHLGATTYTPARWQI